MRNYPYYQMNLLAPGGVSIQTAIVGPTFSTEQIALSVSCQCHAYEKVIAAVKKLSWNVIRISKKASRKLKA